MLYKMPPPCLKKVPPVVPQYRPSVTLRLYLLNGHFIKEDVVLADTLIESYVWDLETGTIEPTLQLPWDPVSGGSFYQLLWEDKI